MPKPDHRVLNKMLTRKAFKNSESGAACGKDDEHPGDLERF